MRFFIFILFLINDSIYCQIDWKDGNWALACDFPENDIENANTPGEDCSNKCKQTNSCTHFTWTTWNGGTCWMKSGSVSKSDAHSTDDSTMVCGIVSEDSSTSVNWQPGDGADWAFACDFKDEDLTNAQTRGEDCSGRCASTSGCTHFTWTTWNGGTCWMKGGAISRDDAIFTNDNSMVCGVLKNQGIQKGDLVWSDDFNNNGKPDSSKWRFETGGNGWGNNEAQFYTDSQSNAYTSGGNLVIEAKKEDYGGKKYTSVRLITNQKFKYGVFEMRAKLPQGRGSWPAFWLLAAKRPLDWPRDGEIDIMEHVGYDPAVVHATIHCKKYNALINTQKTSTKRVNNPFNDFHTYTLDWNSNRIIVYIDQQQIFRFDNERNFEAWPYDNDFNVILNLAIGGNWGGVQGIDDSIFPVRYVIDYIKIYKSIAN